MKTSRLLISVISILLIHSSHCRDDGQFEGDDESKEETLNPIEISSKSMDYASKTVIIRQGKQLMFSCVYQRDDLGEITDLNWKKDHGKVINGESSPNVFTIGVTQHKTGNKKKNLHFTHVHKRDEGTYECIGRSLSGKHYSDKVKITVLDEIEWSNPSKEAGALVGEPLTIDCDVKKLGQDAQITITNGDGEPLDSERFTIVGNEVTIEKLSKDYDRQNISCVHVELVSRDKQDEVPIVDNKNVIIDVWFQPEFEEDEIDQYAIIDENKRSAVLQCNVTASNPPARHYAFFKGTEKLEDDKKYELVKEVGKVQGAYLKIHDVDESDLDEYRCEVSNGKAKSSLIIQLKEASPPAEPKVSLHGVKKHSISWKIVGEEKEGELPVQKIEIMYVRTSIVRDRLGLEEGNYNIADEFWSLHGTKLMREKNSKHLYEVSGLRQESDYVFKFRQLSEAGPGEPVVLFASTASERNIEKSATSSIIPIVFLLFFSLLFW